MKIIDNIKEVDVKQWDLLLLTSSQKSFFQTKNCYDLYNANQPFMTPFLMGVEDNDVLKGIIIGYIQADV